jgi:PPP family 3-phenylpropionic acid transporter
LIHLVANDRRLLAARGYYFLFYAALAGLIPYLVIYYQSLGLDGRQIGLLSGLPPLMLLVGAPLWASLADAMHRHRLLFGLATMAAIAMALVIGETKDFFLLIPVVAVYALLSSPIVPMVDSSVMALLGEKKSHYGRIRLWGAVGWGFSAPLVGLLIERSGLQWAFWSYAMLLALGWLVSRSIPLGQARLSGSFWGNLRGLLTNRGWVLFLALAFIGGLSLSATTSFLFLFMGDLGASQTLMGLALTVSTLSEAPFLFFTDRLLGRFGARGMLVFGLCSYIVRSLAYSLVPAAWPVLLIQLLHGPSFSSVLVAGVSYADQIAPAGLGTTAQGLFSGVFMGVGSATGALLGGVLFDGLGGAGMFRALAGIVSAGLLIYLILDPMKRRR